MSLPRPGTLDGSFGSEGFQTLSLGSQAAAVAPAVQPDGKVVTVGAATVAGTNMLVSTRMTPGGQLDPTYGNDGVVELNTGGGAAGNAVAIQPDGKIVLAGYARLHHVRQFVAVRLLPNGQLDETFGDRGVANVAIGSQSIANAVAIQRDGKIVLGGTTLNGIVEFAAARLTADGRLDSSFGLGGVTTLGQPGAAWGMALEPDGRIVLAGSADSPLALNIAALGGVIPGGLASVLRSGERFMAARLLPNGVVDPGFGVGGIAQLSIGNEGIAFAVATQPNGDVLVAGNSFTNRVDGSVARLLPGGTLDPHFGDGGVATIPRPQGINAVTVEPSGAIALAGVGATAIRLRSDGELDSGFGTGGIVTVPIDGGGGANGLAIAPGQKLVLAGATRVNGQLVMTAIRMYG